jgi:fatty aldehyde-generating acyl-ACP reductase
VKFAFIIHPTSLEDVARYEPGAVGKGRPLIEKIMEWMPAYAAVHVTGVRAPDGRETEGWFVAANFMPEPMLALAARTVYGKILDAIEIGASLGAEIAGSGRSRASSATRASRVAERSPIPVTTGNSLTIAAGVRSLFARRARDGGRLASATAVVVGATGSIGSACVEPDRAARRARRARGAQRARGSSASPSRCASVVIVRHLDFDRRARSRAASGVSC